MLSYKAIIEKFEEFAEAHFIIKSYGTGEAWQIIEHNKQANRKYPMMWVEDMPFPTSGVIGQAGVTTYAYRVYFLQQVPTLKNTTLTTLEQANVVRAKSDMLQCAQDLQSYWGQDHVFDELDLDRNTLATPFHDILNDSLTGFYIDIKLEQAFNYNSCAIPMSGVTPPDSPIVTITINGASFTTVDCGLTEDIIVKDTNGAQQGSKVGNEWIVPAAGGDPATNSMNGTELTDIAAGGDKDFTIRYEDDSAVVVTTISDSATAFIGEVPNPVIALNTADIFKTGATTSFQSQDDGDKKFGRGVDFFTLDFNNGFGNTNRFTDDLGLQTYTSDVIVDWSTWNQVTDKVTCYFKTVNSSANLTNQINGQPYTKNSLSGWFICNPRQITNLFNYSVFRNYLNYTPFNYSVTSTVTRLWTSFRESTTVGLFFGGFSLSVSSQGTASQAMVCRVYTLTELGL